MFFFSVIQSSQLDRFLAAAESLRKNCREDFQIHVLIVDEGSRPLSNFLTNQIHVYYPENFLKADALMKFYRNYTLRQVLWLFRPLFATFLLENPSVQRMIYFSPELYFTEGPNTLWKELETSEILFTPHFLRTSPMNDFSQWEFEIQQRGLFNLGIFGIRKSPQTFRFLQWWSSKLEFICSKDSSNPLYEDQRLLDQAIVEFPALNIWKDPGYNIGYWNLHRFELSTRKGRLFAGESPLICFHFCDVSLNQQAYLSKFGRHRFSEFPLLKKLFLEYQKNVQSHQTSSFRTRSPARFVEIFRFNS